ncbi:MAG: hypothetical protein OEO20_12045 [Gemmatimonadota bacterium]|nr:hypothetical protein [Gemmatimonadota bacterium]MDH3367653.1 hypothetical protein [Gemmatimonadota bacterium]MDH3479026.1 hypothetical protein [Gemmatimonadota bacterium]MDH3569854.1 hypothetical protein [Gemmatimonadota bacterium]MDH5549529.1 hypothetical protein [Gemmatimonadota bacterium]
MEVTLAAEPGGASITAPVEIRNVGAAGTIDWTATDDATWITLNPASGSASDVTPDQFDVVANPSGLGTGFYTGFVTISGNAANSPVTMRVRLAVAPRIALDAAITTAGMLPVGERVRYLLSGTAGQEIDVAVLTDYSASPALIDPVVRVYKPDGETLLDWNDMAPYAGLGFQALVYRVYLPETGDYVVEVGAWADAFGGGYLLKARPAAAILGFSWWGFVTRGEQNGSSLSTPLTVFDLTGLGTVAWTGSPSESWITIDPTSGTASQTGELITLEDFSIPEVREETGVVGQETGVVEQSEVSGVDPAVARPLSSAFVRGLLGTGDYELSDERLAEPLLAWVKAAARGKLDSPRLTNDLQETSVEVTLNPTGVPEEWNFGSIQFQAADGWLQNQIVELGFYVYSEGMAIISSGHDYAWGMATGDTRNGPPSVMVATRDNGGSLIPISPDGTVGAPIATGIGSPGGVALGEDGNWYVGIRDFAWTVRRVTPDGTVSDFKVLPDGGVFWLTWGPQNDLFGSSRCLNSGQVYRIPLDGSAEDPISTSLPSCVGGVAYRPQDNSVYVANNLSNYGLTKVSLDDGSSTTLASSVYDVQAVAVGRSGIVYFTDDTGRVWSIDPDLTSTATQLALAPGFYNLFGLALTEGALMFLSGASDGFGEFYTYPVNDGPLPHPAGQALYVARFAPEDMSTADYPGVGDPRAMHGEPFKLPQILYSKDDSNLPVAAFVEEISWSPADMTYVAVEEGDFGGTFLCNDADAGTQGTLPCTGARTDAVGVPRVTLLTLQLQSDPALQPDACVSIAKDVTELSGELGEDLLSLVEWSNVNVGVSEYAFGDVTHDGAVGAADAVQCLRDLVSLPICPTCDVAMCDVDRDAAMTGTDAVYILRWLVSLGLPPYHRIAMHGLEECQVP